MASNSDAGGGVGMSRNRSGLRQGGWQEHQRGPTGPKEELFADGGGADLLAWR